MRLYLIRPVEGDPAWSPWYDKAFGFVVRAESEAQAREFAQADAGDEEIGPDYDTKIAVWQDPARSTCVELTALGDAGVVLRDFHAA